MRSSSNSCNLCRSFHANAIQSIQAHTTAEAMPTMEAPAPGMRLTDFAKEAKCIADGLSEANKPAYRSSGQYKARSHQGGKPFRSIANEASRAAASLPSGSGPVDLNLELSTDFPCDKAAAAEPSASLAHAQPSCLKRRAIRDGGHENFVRSTMKKGKSSFKFKSKSGCSSRNPKNRRWAMHKMAAESLPVAGLGADNANEASLVGQSLMNSVRVLVLRPFVTVQPWSIPPVNTIVSIVSMLVFKVL